MAGITKNEVNYRPFLPLFIGLTVAGYGLYRGLPWYLGVTISTLVYIGSAFLGAFLERTYCRWVTKRRLFQMIITDGSALQALKALSELNDSIPGSFIQIRFGNEMGGWEVCLNNQYTGETMAVAFNETLITAVLDLLYNLEGTSECR
jgi:hypothetical protein